MEMHDLCAIAAREPRCVLATAVKVEGHAYRKQGVSMLLTEEGVMYGSISPGCLESDLQARVDRVLDTQQLEFVEYDMRPEDDLSWGETIGCGGLIIVLLEPVCAELRSILSHMHTYFQSGSAVELTRSFYDQYTRIHYVIQLAEDAESQTSLSPSPVAKGASLGPINTLITEDTPRLSLVVIHSSEADAVASNSGENDLQRHGLTDIPLQISQNMCPNPV
ncbi:XdhC and CoxI family protein [Paenibacillus sp. OK060]|uniref:XdhC family protein n=1 Tax=Paenibacillus sp. OK060 TaxID=1881034 RepID=UPI00088B782F|nr:XdhC family protein [Paenibacillus sp. OK060]SDK22980.1 XdhC and CoxI family protein [Paenibacillus sp. OK060]